jgi:hypothetical protein
MTARECEETYRTFGSSWWPETYGKRPGDDLFALTHISAEMQRRNVVLPQKLANELRVGLVKWADQGFPKIIIKGHRYAAALLCTRVSSDTADDLRLPWDSFCVQLPDDLVVYPDGKYAAAVFVWRLACDPQRIANGEQFFLGIVDSAGAQDTMRGGSLEEVLFTDLEAFERVGDVESTNEDRVRNLCRRAVVGALFTMQFTDNFKDNAPRDTRSESKRHGPPSHRVVVIGAPIALDARAEVRAYLEGSRKGGLPSVQTLVRGHYKRQVVGVGGTGRRVIWVQPYWRGPEDAPILSRPHTLAADAKASAVTS